MFMQKQVSKYLTQSIFVCAAAIAILSAYTQHYNAVVVRSGNQGTLKY
jgi:hypothetical protein